MFMMVLPSYVPALKMQNYLSSFFCDFLDAVKMHCKWASEKHHLSANSCAVEATAVLSTGLLRKCHNQEVQRASLAKFEFCVCGDKLQALVSTQSTFWTTPPWRLAFLWRKLIHRDCIPCETRSKTDLWMGSRQEEHFCTPEGVRMREAGFVWSRLSAAAAAYCFSRGLHAPHLLPAFRGVTASTILM